MPMKERKDYSKLIGDIEYDLWYQSELQRRKDAKHKKTEEDKLS